MYSEKYTVLSTDINSTLEIRLSQLLRYMQDVATEHANKLNIGHKELLDKRKIWVIVRMDIKINRLPKVDEEFIVSTHPGEVKSFTFPRYFEVYDKHHHLLVSASSIWVTIDYDTRKIQLKPFGDKKLPFETDKDDLPLPEKIVGKADIKVDERKARYSETDMNGHINNTHYFDYVLDTHDAEFHKTHRIKSFCINYDKELLVGELIELYSNKENPEVIQGKVNGANSFTTKIEFEER